MKTNHGYYIKSKILLLTSVLFFGCVGEDRAAGMNSLMSTEIEVAGSNCFHGGIKVNTGLDTNRNNVLDGEEIQTTDYLCNGSGGAGTVELDNLVRINLGSPDFTACGTEWQYTEHNSWQLHDFNKMDYQNVKSILFVPSIVCYDEGSSTTLELFNLTDNVPIANTELTHNSTNFVFHYSENIYDYLPDYPISLCIRVKNKTEDSCGGTGTFSYLYILRE